MQLPYTHPCINGTFGASKRKPTLVTYHRHYLNLCLWPSSRELVAKSPRKNGKISGLRDDYGITQLFMNIGISAYEWYIDIYIYIYTYLEPKWPLFWLKRALFGGLTFKNRGQLGSRYICLGNPGEPFKLWHRNCIIHAVDGWWFRAHQLGLGCKLYTYKVGPLPVVNGVATITYNPYKWPYKWVTAVITLLIGVTIPFVTGRGPPCIYV